jgi:L-arabinonolactonase
MAIMEKILSCENQLGEGPVWDGRSRTLYWLDIEGLRLWNWRMGQEDPVSVPLEIAVGAVGLTAAKHLVAATAVGFAFLDPRTGGLDPVLTPAEKDPAVRFNDGAVGPDGGFWAGTLSEEPVNFLYRLDPDLTCRVKESSVRISNGIGWSPDQSRMYYTDSLTKRIDVYEYDSGTGAIANRRPFVDPADEPGVPDGLAVDSQGCVWSARWDGWKVTRYDPDGAVMQEISMPVQRPTSCAFGGEDLTELFITSAWTGLDRSDKQHEAAGGLFRLHAGVRGQEEYLFGS